MLDIEILSKSGIFNCRYRGIIIVAEQIIFDEWLRESLSASDSRNILDFIDERYQNRSCLFCSQLPVKHWHEQIKDPTMADAILDRIVHNAHRLNITGESMRKKNAV